MENNFELWKDIKGFEGLYQISNYGRIRGLLRMKQNGSKQNIVLDRIKPSYKAYKGYYICNLWKNGVQHTLKTHRLVGIHWVNNPHNYPQLNHKDKDKSNNRADNLEWCTNEYNLKHSWAAPGGHVTQKKGSDGYSAKPVYQISYDGFLIGAYGSVVEASLTTGFRANNIARWARKERKCLTHKWSY